MHQGFFVELKTHCNIIVTRSWLIESSLKITANAKIRHGFKHLKSYILLHLAFSQVQISSMACLNLLHCGSVRFNNLVHTQESHPGSQIGAETSVWLCLEVKSLPESSELVTFLSKPGHNDVCRKVSDTFGHAHVGAFQSLSVCSMSLRTAELHVDAKSESLL